MIVQCPNAMCRSAMQLPEHAGGCRVQCPICRQPFLAPTPAGVPVGAAAGPGVHAAPTTCPACGSGLSKGAVGCGNCGFVLAGAAPEPQSQPILCGNPECRSANPRGERICLRCGE